MKCTSNISIHHYDRLYLKKIRWKLWLTNSQRKLKTILEDQLGVLLALSIINSTTLVDDIDLLENYSIQAQKQLYSIKTEAGKVDFKINVQKTEQM